MMMKCSLTHATGGSSRKNTLPNCATTSTVHEYSMCLIIAGKKHVITSYRCTPVLANMRQNFVRQATYISQNCCKEQTAQKEVSILGGIH